MRQVVAVAVLTGTLLLVPTARSEDAAGHNPRVSLSLRQATADEALLALEQRTGIALTLVRNPLQISSDRRLDERQDFQWKGVPLADAIREVANWYDLLPWTQSIAGFRMLPGYGPEHRRVEPLALPAQVESWSVSATGVTTREAASAPRISRFTEITLRVASPTDDPHRIDSLRNITAEDETGQPIAISDPLPGASRVTGADSWETRLALPAREAGPRRLRWIEGDLFAYPQMERRKLLLPAPFPYMQHGFVVRRFAVGRNHPTAEPRITIDFEQKREQTATRGIEWRWSGSTVVTRDGRRYLGTSASSLSPELPATDSPIERVELAAVERSPAVKIGRFRLSWIPLAPIAEGSHRPTASSHGPQVDSLRRFAAPAGTGGALSSEVRIDGKPARGRIVLGLRPLNADDTTAGEWVQLPLDAEGRTELRGILPGRYRVLRAFHADRGQYAPAGGRWRNGEQVVMVAAGSVANLPPLEWIMEPMEPMEPMAPAVPEVREARARESRGVTATVNQTVQIRHVWQSSTVSSSLESAVILSMTVKGQSPKGPRLAGLANIVARDDRGNILTTAVSEPDTESLTDGAWSADARLPLSNPNARRLAWLEADLLVEEGWKSVTVNAPLTGTEAEQRTEGRSDGVALTARGRATNRQQEPGDLREGTWGPALRVQVTAPTSSYVRGHSGRDPELVLVGKSGREYPALSALFGQAKGTLGFGFDRYFHFPVVDEPVVAVRCRLQYRRLRTVKTVRVENVVIPEFRAQ